MTTALFWCRVVPTIMIVLDVVAACVWWFAMGDWRRAMYWLAAAALTYSITW